MAKSSSLNDSALTYCEIHRKPSPYPCLMTTEHMKISIGRISLRGTLPYFSRRRIQDGLSALCDNADFLEEARQDVVQQRH